MFNFKEEAERLIANRTFLSGRAAAAIRQYAAECERDALRAENAKLRAAMRDIARQPEGDEESAQAVARAVLRELGEGN
jgi:hypothetical protein